MKLVIVQAGEDSVRRSKLALVDLAGSERMLRSGIEGTTLREARHINLSLHYLEQVIVALQVRCCASAGMSVVARSAFAKMQWHIRSEARELRGRMCPTAIPS